MGYKTNTLSFFLWTHFHKKKNKTKNKNKKKKQKNKNKTNSRGELNLHNNVQKPIIRKGNQKIVSNSLAKLAPKF